MPIRFRCPTCTGLMSIARRKASSVVSCPKCGEQVIVPAPERVAAAANGSTENRPLFERPDFESLLSKAGVAAPPTPAKRVAVADPVVQDTEPPVLTLSYPAAAMIGVACSALVVVSFAAGYLLK